MQLSYERALVIAPHPDDEVFGCGGTIRRLRKKGAEVYVMYVTVGTTQDRSAKGSSSSAERMEEVERVARYLDLSGYDFALPGDEYHLQLDTVPQKELIRAIEVGSEVSFERIRPDIVLTPSVSDYNQDHRAVSHATLTAARPASRKLKHFQPLIASYELPYHQWNIAETQTSPSVLIRLEEDDLAEKLEALSIYASQLKDPSNPLSLRGAEAMARYRGLQCDAPAAEAFQLARLVL